jgi:NADH-quinone oxidoreductase subunit N
VTGDLWFVLVPLLATAGAVAALLADLVLPPARMRLAGLLTAAFLAAALAASFVVPAEGVAFGGAFHAGPWTTFVQRVVLVSALIAILGGLGHVASAWPRRQGEYHVLLACSVAGMLVLPGARDLVLLIASFELMGIPLYALAALGKTDAPRRTAASEAALKFYVAGAASSAVTLFGVSLMVLAAGGTSLQALSRAPADHPLLVVGSLMALGGMGFKIGAAPFHAWVPDTYEGASTPFVAFLSVAPKAGGFAALVSVLVVGLPQAREAWLPVVLAVAVLTMTLGNLLAIPQTSVKRLLAYSGIAQVGYVLLGLAAGTERGLAMLLFYLATYVVSNAGAFLVAHAVAASDGDESVAGLDGLARRSPWLAASLLACVLSLAGIPFAAGFWAKLSMFLAAWEAGLAWLVLAGAVLAIVALFYYLGLAKAAYVAAPRLTGPVAVGWPLRIAILACVAGVVGLGLWPRPLVESAERAASALLSSR